MNRYIVTHETIVLDTDFEKCQLNGFVELTVSLQKQYFYIKEEYHDSYYNRISFNLPVFGSEANNFKIHEVTVDGHTAKYQERPPYLRRINKNFTDFADLHNFETLFLSNVADVTDYGELMITIPSQLLNSNVPHLNFINKSKQKQSNGYDENYNGHSNHNEHNGHNESDQVHQPPHKKRKLSNGYSHHNGYNQHNGHNGHNGYSQHNGYHNNHNNDDDDDNHNNKINGNGDEDNDIDLKYIPKKEEKMDDENKNKNENENDNDNDNDNNDDNDDFMESLLEPFIVKIAFSVKEPIDGIHWVVPRDSKDGTPSTSPSLSLSATNSNPNSRASSVAAHSPNKPIRKIRKRAWGQMENDDELDEQKKNEVMYPDRKPHMYSYNCHWVPCINTLKHRCTYTLQLSVPLDYMAICNGDLTLSKSNMLSSKSIYIYDIKQPVSARNLTFAVGPFTEIILNDVLPDVATALSPMNDMNIDEDEEDEEEDDDENDDEEKSGDSDNNKIKKEKKKKKKKKDDEDTDSDDDEDEDDDDDDDDNDKEEEDENEEEEEEEDDDDVIIKLYVLPSNINNIITSCYNIFRMISVYENYLDLDFPFTSLSFVFVDEAYDMNQSSYLNLNILSTDLIHSDKQIEQSYETNDILSRCIATNWMNYALNIDKMEDIWIQIGFIGLLQYEWLSIYEGRNEMEYRVSIWRLHREEIGPHPHQHPVPPLSWNGYLHLQQLYVLHYDYIKWKSLNVMRMLQQLLGSQSFKRNVIKNIMNGSLCNNKITTNKLQQHLCGIYSEKQINKFFHDFIYGDSCPKICGEYSFRKKDNRHILCLKQEQCSGSYCNVLGTLKLQIQELDHETIEYVQIPSCDLRDAMRFEFVCQSRAKRKHKNGDNEPWLESPANNDTPTKCIRIDPDYEWLLHLVFFIVPQKIAITQLLHDDIRDIRSQLEAIYSLRMVPCRDVSDALLLTLNDEMNFYRVRLEAAKALAEDRNPETLHENKTELINIIKKLWNKRKQKQGKQINYDRKDIINYFLIKHIIEYLSTLCKHKHPHYTPIEIVDLIINLLKELIDSDDNYNNIYCHESLIASMIINLGNIRISIQQYIKINEIADLLSQILSLQRLFVSHRGIVRSACLKTFALLHLNHPTHQILNNSIKKVKAFCKYGKFHDEVRLTAFEIMVNLIKDCKKTIKKCLRIIATERVPGVKMKMLKIWAISNIKNDYFMSYQEIADELHRVQHNTMQSLNSKSQSLSVSVEKEEILEEKEEKLDAINLRPTLRGYRSSNFIKQQIDGNRQITECSFINLVLRTEKSLNQQFIASNIWNYLLRSIDKRYCDKYYKSQILCDQSLIINEDKTMYKSIDLMFGIYFLYKSIWGFTEPPFFDKKIGAILLPNNIGNQKRVHDAIQHLKSNFNNNNPQFCSFGAQFWRCS